MRVIKRAGLFSLALVVVWVASGCVTQPNNANVTTTNTNANANTSAAASPEISSRETSARDAAPSEATLPVLDAFFSSDENFSNDLKTKVGLTDEQVQKLRTVAREETGNLRESDTDDVSGNSERARTLATQRVKEIVGEEKTSKLFDFLRDRWQDSGGPGTTSGSVTTNTPNAVPKDTRVVVNSPAYRMDVFENGKLVKSYRVGIGYPEFPLPTGLRKASTIIFNPSWTPPDEPWVESKSSKVKVGEKVEAGSKLNPLGLLKIPIGLPSLIHGGKSPAKLGTFASHGCVGLTDPLAQDFAKELARIGGANLTDADINSYKKERSETKQIALKDPVPVELRYETIVAENGKLHIYRDVYDHNTNTEENLKSVLQTYGVGLDDLTEAERSQVNQALTEMSRDASGKADQPNASASPTPGKNTSTKVTRAVKGRKEIVIDIAALKGKGYPAMASGGSGTGNSKT